MKLKSASCGKCRNSIPLAPKLLSFKPAPKVIECGACHTKMSSSIDFKYTYYYFYALKLCIILSVPYVAPQAFSSSYGSPWIMFPLGVILIGGIFGIIASFILAFPIMFIMEIVGSFTGIGRKSNRRSETL